MAQAAGSRTRGDWSRRGRAVGPVRPSMRARAASPSKSWSSPSTTSSGRPDPFGNPHAGHVPAPLPKEAEMAVQRDRPYAQFNFLVDIGTGETEGARAGFQEC